MFEVAINEFTLLCHPTALPQLYGEYQKRAALAEEFGLDDPDMKQSCFVGVRRGTAWPFITVAQKYWPAGAGFHPAVLLVPETSRLFVGAGERLLAYDLQTPKRLWLDSADTGFWHWHRHGDFVLMSAELEFAAWTKEGAKLWTTFVEPPWEYEIDGDTVVLDVMGKKTSFPLRLGPKTLSQ